ncbi:MAG: hypothetical protein JO023_03670 [Chloroflexi bacterium]|nr:hypothetical protein [Chloroflexota bacterium]
MSVPRALAGDGMTAPTGLGTFDVSQPYSVAMRLALALALLPGLGIGLLLVLIVGAGLPVTLPWPQLAQSHGQVQALGFVMLFIVAVGLQLFPRFLGAPPLHAERAVWGAWTIAVALVARLLAQPSPDGTLREALLVCSALGVPAGAILAGSAFHGLSRRSIQPRHGPAAAWRQFVAVGGLALGLALALYVWTTLTLASGLALVPFGIDEALTHLELAGFATCLVFAVASRIFGRFLLLRAHPAFESGLPWLARLWGVGLLLVAIGWSADAAWAIWLRWLGASLEVVVAVSWVWLIGLYRSPSRPSGTPHVTAPTRRWLRWAFAFLLASLALYLVVLGRAALFGLPPLSNELSAARHALGQGFLLIVMASVAARLLPIYSADVLHYRPLLEATIDLLFAGALLRVVAEWIGAYQFPAGLLAAFGGTLTVVGFCIFAARLWRSLSGLTSRRSVPSAHA